MHPTPTLTVAESAKILGISVSSAYSAIRSNEFPAKVLKIGNRYVIPTKPFLQALGLDELPELSTANEVA